MAQVWIAIFFILLAVAQLYQSIKDINLPLPVYLVLGTILAIASNSQYKLSFDRHPQVSLQDLTEPTPVLTSVQVPLLADDILPVVER
jgi:hypothetical protein